MSLAVGKMKKFNEKEKNTNSKKKKPSSTQCMGGA
jgi:hypothetical protein